MAGTISWKMNVSLVNELSPVTRRRSCNKHEYQSARKIGTKLSGRMGTWDKKKAKETWMSSARKGQLEFFLIYNTFISCTESSSVVET